MKPIAKKILYGVLPVSSILIIILGWFYVSYDKPLLFPTPMATVEKFIKLIERPLGRVPLWQHIWDSLRRVGIAVFCASILGVIFGILIGWFKALKASIGSIFEIIRPIPPIAWIPLITIWFGIGELSKVLIVFIGTFAIVVVNTYSSVSMVDPINISVGKMFHASNFQILREIVLPASFPAIFAGIRMAIGAGWAIVLAAEMIGATSGTGFLIFRGNETGDTALVFVGMFLIGVIGALISLVTTWIERKVTPWIE